MKYINKIISIYKTYKYKFIILETKFNLKIITLNNIITYYFLASSL